MLTKKMRSISDLFFMSYVRTKCQAHEIKNDEDAMEVIQVVMLIAVGVLAIAAVWAGVSGLLTDLWEQITGNATLEEGPTLE